jgi:hypothetical protein
MSNEQEIRLILWNALKARGIGDFVAYNVINEAAPKIAGLSRPSEAPSDDMVEQGADPARSEPLICACGKQGERRSAKDHAEIRELKAEAGRHCPDALAYINELEALWRGAERQGNVWRGIASAMGYEPRAHAKVKPTHRWLLDRIAHYRAALSAMPGRDEVIEALEPFAREAEDDDGFLFADDATVGDGGAGQVLTFADLRRARKAIRALRASPLKDGDDAG